MRHRNLIHRRAAVWCSLLILVVGLGVFATATLVGSSVALGEDAAKEAAPAEDVTPPDEPVVEAPAEKAPAADGEAAAPQQESYLVFTYKSLGMFYSIVFLALSFILVALVVMNVLTARRESILPVALIESFEAQLNEKQYQKAYELAKSDESFLGQVLSAGLGKLSQGYDQAIEAMQEVGEEENMKLEHRLSYIALIGTISPMFGLLGHGPGHDRLVHGDRRQQHRPKTVRVGPGHLDGLVHHAGRAVHRHSGGGGLQHPPQPRRPPRSRGRHRQRRPDEPLLQSRQEEGVAGPSRATKTPCD